MAGDLNEGAPENIGYMVAYAEELHEPGATYTVIHNGKIILCCGIVNMWPGVGEGWGIASSYIHQSKMPFIRVARQVLDDVVEKNNLWRVQGVVKVGWASALRFSKFFGFEVEGVMRQYGPERGDYFRIARIYDGN